MNKGIIIDETKLYYSVFSNEGEYLKIVKDLKTEVGSEIYFTSENIYKETRTPVNKLVAVAASIILMVIWISANVLNPIVSNAVAVVSVDINPSMEFYINRHKKVQSFKTYNEEAEQLLSERLIGQSIDEAIEEVIQRAMELDYLSNQNNAVIIAQGVLEEDYNLDIDNEISNIVAAYTDQEIEIAYMEVSSEFIRNNNAKEESIGIKAMNELKQNPNTTEISSKVNGDALNIEKQEEKREREGEKSDNKSEKNQEKIEREMNREEKKTEKVTEQENKENGNGSDNRNNGNSSGDGNDSRDDKSNNSGNGIDNGNSNGNSNGSNNRNDNDIGNSKSNDNSNSNGNKKDNGNDKDTSNDSGNSNGNNNGNGNTEDKGNDKDTNDENNNGNGNGNDNGNSNNGSQHDNGNGNDKDNENTNDNKEENSNSKKNVEKESNGKNKK